jgi:hypothetical protein
MRHLQFHRPPLALTFGFVNSRPRLLKPLSQSAAFTCSNRPSRIPQISALATSYLYWPRVISRSLSRQRILSVVRQGIPQGRTANPRKQKSRVHGACANHPDKAKSFT